MVKNTLLDMIKQKHFMIVIIMIDHQSDFMHLLVKNLIYK
jgi:hypothetical protein